MVKRRRGLPNRARKPIDASYWAERNFNTVEDRSADHHAAQRNTLLAQAMALPGVAAAHAACVKAHKSRISEILKDADEARLFTRLALLRDSVPPDDAAGLDLLRIMNDAQDNKA